MRLACSILIVLSACAESMPPDGGEPGCGDGIHNGLETDVDCGGDCGACGDGQTCNDAIDCISEVCVSSACQTPACDDGVVNGDESSVDCGGSCATDCGVCERCVGDDDCDTTLCLDTLCAPTITVLSAVYASNCGAPTAVATIPTACDGLQSCAYSFNYTVDIGYDPAYGCYKDLRVEYTCSGSPTTRTFYESCAPCDPQNTPTMINLELDCLPCIGEGQPPIE
jgi:hypothetical protein